ncbi:zinc ribbon domain-containing protein [Streptomyces sp. Ncost-T10-10d]|uniref:zinc ribbon domain-containing protein n=1 Tax=Streptomyces sp. Ncost-T10-10d TaxID=1839774 RepID=UPI00081E3C7A|nr:zinc ribbon domain-containing protein [Streptomyces sp. Ncost-T10-10d]SCF94860.1 transposase, IS605 OrfB family, central region [Streptomyces sp. Ncost-T10-10d]
MKVTRIAYSKNLNQGKYAQLDEQARRLGAVRSLVWRLYGSVSGLAWSDRQIRDVWIADGTAQTFDVLANAWKETVRDTVADITANREAAKVKVRRAINQRTKDEGERKRLFTSLKRETWADDPFLARQMRRHWKHGRNRTHNQIVVRADQYKTFTLTAGGNIWLAVPGLERRQLVRIPLNTTVAPTGTLRLVLRSGRVEVHYAIDAEDMKSSQRPVGTRTIGVDKGYSEVLTDSDGRHHGTQLGDLLTSESDHRKVKNARRAKIRSVAEKAEQRGDHAKARRIRDNNLGAIKRDRRSDSWRCRVRDLTFKAVHAVADKASLIVAEDLTKTFASGKKLGKNTNRRLAAWTKGVTAEALEAVSDRRGSAVRLVNAAYTSQVVPFTNIPGVRKGDRLHCTECGAVWQADHAGAVNILHREGDPDITLFTPHTRVKQLLQERTDRQRPRLPMGQDSSTRHLCRCGERNIRLMLNSEQ